LITSKGNLTDIVPVLIAILLFFDKGNNYFEKKVHKTENFKKNNISLQSKLKWTKRQREDDLEKR